VVTRPDESASTPEIAQWMEEDFWEHVVGAVEEAVEDESSVE
jgi:hypothetical protein